MSRKIGVFFDYAEWLAVMRACWIAESVTQSIPGVQGARDLPARSGYTFGATVHGCASAIRRRLSDEDHKTGKRVRVTAKDQR